MLTTENLFIRCVRLPIINTLKPITIMAFGKGYFGTLAEGAVNAATGGLLGVGLDAISGAINNKYQKQMIDYQVDAQKDLQDYAYEQQLDFWNKQNEYNDPSAMVNRLRQAGLNPAMLNGNAAVNQAGNLSSISTPSAPQGGRQSTNSVAAMTSLASIAQSMAQTGFLDEQAKLMTQKILSELLEQNIKEIAALTGMSEAELKRMDAEATYEAYYGTAIDGGEPRIKNNPVLLAMQEQRGRISITDATAAKIAQEIVTEMYEQQRISADTQLSLSAASLNRAKEATERVLLDGRKVAQTISNEMASYELELSKKYRDEYLSADLQGKQAVAARALAELKEYLSTAEYRESLRAAGLSEAEANASIANSKAIVESIDANDYQYVFDNFMHRGTGLISLLDHFIWNLTRN